MIPPVLEMGGILAKTYKGMGREEKGGRERRAGFIDGEEGGRRKDRAQWCGSREGGSLEDAWVE